MSAAHTYLLLCDNCDARFVPSNPVPKQLSQIRPNAAKAGWEHRLIVIEHGRGLAPSLDFCPTCVRLRAPDVHEERIRRAAS